MSVWSFLVNSTSVVCGLNYIVVLAGSEMCMFSFNVQKKVKVRYYMNNFRCWFKTVVLQRKMEVWEQNLEDTCRM